MIKLKSLFRRGPSGPSSSKQAAAAAAASATAAQGNALQQQQQPPLKGASSVSSLDHHQQQQQHSTDVKQSKSQKHGSKDRLTSREKLCSSRESLDLKEASSKRQQQPTQPHRQMPLVQQQPPQQPLQQQSTAVQQHQQHSHHHHLGGNNNLLDAGGYAAMVVDPALTKELTDISFDGPREVSVMMTCRRSKRVLCPPPPGLLSAMCGGRTPRFIDRLAIMAGRMCAIVPA